MPAESIEYYNRYTRKVETEEVYGEKWLRWTYGTLPGRFFLWTAARRAWFSRWYGWRMDRPQSRSRVQPFCEQYDVDVNEFAKAPGEFESFNDFFYRKLKPEARPINQDPATVVFPADGRHLGFQNIAEVESIFVKGQRFDLPVLLQDDALAEKYSDGTLVFSRLCPVDYHRFHFPADGVPGKPELINGPLYSVNPIALRRNIRILFENKRVTTRLATERFGDILTIEVGATCVGDIVQTFSHMEAVGKGEEKGYFRFGGSAVITLFEGGRVRLARDLVENTGIGRELYGRMGDGMAVDHTVAD